MQDLLKILISGNIIPRSIVGTTEIANTVLWDWKIGVMMENATIVDAYSTMISTFRFGSVCYHVG